MTRFTQYPVIGLALSGGGARGLAHIGVLKVLEREGIEIDCLTGSSMGGIIAAAYAAGRSASELEAAAIHMSKLRELIKLVDPIPPRRGLIAGRRVRSLFADFVPPEMGFADLRLPLGLMAVDLLSGEEVPLVEGSVLDAMLATSAFPGVFPAVAVNGHWLVDGGLLNNLPVDLSREMGAEVVIAVDVSTDPTQEILPEAPANLRFLPDMLWDSIRAIKLMTSTLTQNRIKESKPEVLIRPELPSDVGIFSSFTRAAEIIAIGAYAASHKLPQILEAIHSKEASVSLTAA